MQLAELAQLALTLGWLPCVFLGAVATKVEMEIPVGEKNQQMGSKNLHQKKIDWGRKKAASR